MLIKNAEIGILSRKQSAARRKEQAKQSNSPLPKKHLKRAGSALNRHQKQTDFGKTLARMQIVQHLNKERGL